MQIYRIKSRYDNKLNAKDLALAKINAGPKMFGFYAYGISLGMDIRDLAKIINSPQGRAISKICEGNIINGEMGAFSALQAIEKLEGNNLYNDFVAYDVKAISEKGNSINVILGRKGVELIKCKTASEALFELIKPYYTETILKNSKLKNQITRKAPNTTKKGKFKEEKSLEGILYQIAVAGKMNDCINWITTSEDSLYKNLNSGLNDAKNKKEWLYSFNQLLEKCLKYGEIQKQFRTDTIREESINKEFNFRKDRDYHHYDRDLKILAEGAEEMRILGTILSSNKGVKSKIEDGLNFIKTIENAVIDRKNLMGLVPNPGDKIDFILFCTDADYRENAIQQYEEVKHSVNILDVISTAPHFLSYLRTCGIPYAAFRMGSSKFRTRLKYQDEIIGIVEPKSSSDKEKVVRGIENAVNYKMLQEWLGEKQLMFILPKGCKKFVGRDLDVKIVEDEDGEKIPLNDDNGLATFKLYMDSVIIPNLINDPSYKDNLFVQGLTTFGLTKTGTHAEVTAYSLEGNLMPHTEAEEILYLNYLGNFSLFYTTDFVESSGHPNAIASYADAFYIYSQYVFGGKRGQKSLMSMFNDPTYALAESFLNFIAQADANNDIEIENIEELIPWCSPDGNIYRPNAEYFYAQDSLEFGTKLMQRFRLRASENPEEAGVDSETDAEGNPVKKKVIRAVQYDTEANRATQLGKLNYVNGSVMELTFGDNMFKVGLNNNIIAGQEQISMKLNGNIINFKANEVTAEYNFIPEGEVDPKTLKLLDFISNPSRIKNVYMVGLDADGKLARGIDLLQLKSLIDEAIKHLNEEC